MVMQYLVHRNEEYIKHIKLFTESVEKILERLLVLEYNIKEVQVILKYISVNDSNDEERKEEWYAKRG